MVAMHLLALATAMVVLLHYKLAMPLKLVKLVVFTSLVAIVELEMEMEMQVTLKSLLVIQTPLQI